MVFYQTLKLQTAFLKPKMNHQRAMIFVDTSLIPLNTRKKKEPVNMGSVRVFSIRSSLRLLTWMTDSPRQFLMEKL